MPTPTYTTNIPTIHQRAILSITIPRDGLSETIEYADGTILGQSPPPFPLLWNHWVETEDEIPLPTAVDWDTPLHRGMDYVKYIIRHVYEAVVTGTHQIVDNFGRPIIRQRGNVPSRREAKAVHHHVCKRCKASSCCTSV